MVLKERERETVGDRDRENYSTYFNKFVLLLLNSLIKK